MIGMKEEIKVLSNDEIARVHNATLDVLENTGVKFMCKSALKVFKEAGLHVDNDDMVYFPPDVVERCIRTAPPRFTRFPLNPEKHKPIRLGDGDVHIGMGSTTAFVLDLDGKYRKGVEQDIANFARLSDEMKNLEIGNGMIWAQDVDPKVFHARYIEVLAQNNGKVMPAGDGLDQKTTEDIINLASIILGGYGEIGKKKTFTMTAVLQRALTWSEEATVIVEAAKAKLPNEICPTPLIGSIHPTTLAGALVQGNAEILSGIVLNQIVNPGAPVICMAWPGMMDMSSVMTNVFGCPEQALISAALVQLANYYKIPSNIVSGLTDSKISDQQAGYEKMLGLLLTALAKPTEIALFGGYVDGGKTANYEQLVIDDEIAGYVKRVLKGIDVNEDKLAIDVINEVGPGGSYLGHDHTLKYFKEEQYFSKLSDRRARKSWEEDGSKDICIKAKEIARQILNTNKPEHLSNDIVSSLEKEVKAIYKREGVEYKPFKLA